ncbi:uncharacterized protein LOC141633409 [Silene latifolia]|uniref:uncharacterized protein LOC141633409 n=1 Tax=Silene latifolia TaxID=37657 RepID=UPI003D783EA1
MGEREEDTYSTATNGKPKYEEQDTRDHFIGGEDESLYIAVSGLLKPIFFPDDKNSASIFRRAKDSYRENLPNLRDASKNSGSKLVKWARNGSPLRLLLVVSVGTITLLTLTGILVLLLFVAAATTNAVILSLFVSLAAAGGCLAIFFACLAAIYIGALSLAVFVISSVTISAIITSLTVTGWIGFFWILWVTMRKSAGIAKNSVSYTGSALSAWRGQQHHHDRSVI